MKTIIAGTRHIIDYEFLKKVVFCSGFEISEVVSGGAPGVDKMGERWAEEFGVPVKLFEADWVNHLKAAGPIRNQKMADYAEALIAIWDGKSRGTADMIRKATAVGLHVYVRSPADKASFEVELSNVIQRKALDKQKAKVDIKTVWDEYLRESE